MAPAALLLALPEAASAHGLVQRSSLPIPDWLFWFAAATVLVVSFLALSVLWPRPKLEDASWRPLPGGRLLGSRAVEIVCGAIGVAVLVCVVVAGYVGDQSPLNNLAPPFILINFWVGMVFASILFGDLFRAFSPWRALGRVLRLRGIRPYPQRLGRWPAAFALLMFTWIELVSGWSEQPSTLVTAVVGYTVLNLVAQFVWGTETWSRRGEAFSVYYGLFARISVFETRERVVGLRPPLAGLPKLDRAAGTVGFVAVMIGTVTFDGLTQGTLWQDFAVDASESVASLGFDAVTAAKIVATLGLISAVLLVAGFYTLGMEGARSVNPALNGARLRMSFIHSLVPIAAVYVAAHYFSFLLFEGQALRYLISDPFGQGWDLFGTATDAIDYSLVTDTFTWYVNVTLVVIGHVAGLVLAHDRALVVFRDVKLAVRSQLWMLLIMLGFTGLALWLLRQAGG